jgi:hypothetical protein
MPWVPGKLAACTPPCTPRAEPLFAAWTWVEIGDPEVMASRGICLPRRPRCFIWPPRRGCVALATGEVMPNGRRENGQNRHARKID